MHKAVLLLSFVMCSACSSLVVQSPSETVPVVLGGSQSKCELKSSQQQWAILFGIYPFKRASLDESVLKGDRAYRITERYTWQDAALSIVGGALLSLNVKTVAVEECGQPYVIRTPVEIEKEEQQIVQAGLDLYMKLASNNGGETVLVLKSGETKIGKIEALDETNIVLSVRSKPDSDNPVDRVILRGGQTVLGTVLRQSKDVVVVKTSSGMKQISKKNIQTILYYKAKNTESKEPEETVESVTILRSDIRRIVLRNSTPAGPETKETAEAKDEKAVVDTPPKKEVEK